MDCGINIYRGSFNPFNFIMSSLCLLNQFFVRLGTLVEELMDTAHNINCCENDIEFEYIFQ
jgi:hypothetical protein